MSHRFRSGLVLAALGGLVLRPDHFVRYRHRPSSPFGGVAPYGVDFFMEEADKGGGGNGEDDPPRRRDPVVTAAKYNNDVNAMARHIDDLEADNFKVRQKRDGYKTELDATKGELETTKGRVPADGTLVLSAEDAKTFEAYKALGDDPAKLKTTIESVAAVTAENASIKRAQELRNIADAAGFKFSVLEDRDRNTPGLEYSIKDVTEGEGKDAKTVKRAFVKFKDGEGDAAPVKEQSLAEYAEGKWTDFLPALRVDATAQSTATQPAGTRVVQQGGNGAAPKLSVYERIRKEAEEKNKVKTEGKPLEERLNMK